MERFELRPAEPREDTRCVAVSGYTLGTGPRIVLLHGWGGRAAQFASFVEPLVAAGFQVIAVDTAAHGESGGEQTSVFEFVDTLTKLSRGLARSTDSSGTRWAARA